METTNQTLTTVNDRVRRLLNKNIKQDIADALQVDYYTVHRWVRDNSSKLTQADSLRVIREHTGLTDVQILTQEPAQA